MDNREAGHDLCREIIAHRLTDPGSTCKNCKLIAAFLDRFEAKVRAEAFREAAKDVPTSWLDPILSGPKAITFKGDSPAIEALLREVKRRIMARAAEAGQEKK